MNFKLLKEPFKAEEIEWRIAQKGMKGEKPWAKVLAYVTNRAIMDRLDEVIGPDKWKNEFIQMQGSFLCGISVKIGDEWVTKWDGAQETNIEATKGGISGAMKRAAVQWGIGRYLYDLPETWAQPLKSGGQYYSPQDKSKGIVAFGWNPPILPPWALPGPSAGKKE